MATLIIPCQVAYLGVLSPYRKTARSPTLIENIQMEDFAECANWSHAATLSRVATVLHTLYCGVGPIVAFLQTRCREVGVNIGSKTQKGGAERSFFG